MININVNSAYPSTDEVYSHELNYGGSRKIAIAFWEDSNPIDLSGKDLTATFVTNKRLIAESVSLTNIDGNTAELNISSTNNYTIIPGKMLVEIEIKEGDKKLYPSTALVVKVRGSILDDAEVDSDSYGNVADIVREVAAARGSYQTLGARLNAYATDIATLKSKFPITYNELAASLQNTINSILSNIDTLNEKFPIAYTDLTTSLQNTINGKFDFVDVSLQSSTIFDSTVVLGKIYHGTISGVEYLWWNVEGNSSTDKTQFRWSKNGIEWRKKENGTWSSWSYAIADNSVTYNALSTTLQEIIDGKVDVSDIEDCMYYTTDTISSVSALNVNAYASEFIKYGLILTSSAATAFEVPSGTKAEMTVTAVGTVSSNNPAIRCITFPGISGLKWYQEVTSIGQTFTAGSWTRVNVRDEVVLKPNTTIGFDSNGCIAQIINVLGTTLGAGYGSNIRAIYINSSITTVSDDVFTTAPNLNSLYIDNVPGAVTFGETIQTKIANREFSVIYRDSINLVRSLAISQKGTYERLIGLLPNYSIGFNSNGSVITRANVTDIGAGGIGNSNVRSIYVAPKVTSISSSIISATIGLTTDTLDLYIDNSQNDINIASEVLSDSRITIHYKGSFSVIDLLLNSQLQLNDRVTTLENTVGGLINGDEVSY